MMDYGCNRAYTKNCMLKTIKHITTRFTRIIFTMMLVSSIAYANNENMNEATFISGGIGQEESDEFRYQAHDYNLRLYLSEGTTGHSITDVPVTITDKRGNTLLNLATAGPMLFLKVAKGTYRIQAEFNGITLRKQITVRGNRGENIYLN